MVRHPPVTVPSGETLLDVLKWRAEHEPDQTAYVFLRDGVTPDAVLTYKELDLKARSIAGYLQSRFAPGTCLLLVYPPGLDFVQAFWGALYAGMVAVPVPPPDAFRSQAEYREAAAHYRGCASSRGVKYEPDPYHASSTGFP